MPMAPSNATKIKRGYGMGMGAAYKPWITANEFSSNGTAEIVVDWIFCRGVHCLSQGEAEWYFILRWDEDNVDIREQYPLWDKGLTNAETRKIAKDADVRHPGPADHIMTTDLLVTESGGGFHAYSVKPDKSSLSKRDKEKLQIEMLYWAARNVPFSMLYKEDADHVLAANIRLVTRFYDRERVFDRYGAIKHMIATRLYAADLAEQPIDTAFLDRVDKENGSLIDRYFAKEVIKR